VLNCPLIVPPTGSLSVNIGYNDVFISFESLLWLVTPSLSFERSEVFLDVLHALPLKNNIRKQQTAIKQGRDDVCLEITIWG